MQLLHAVTSHAADAKRMHDLCSEEELFVRMNECMRLVSGHAGTSGQDPEPTWVARHPLKLCSAYSEVTGNEPPYTTCHSKFLGTVDYMWYTPQVRCANHCGMSDSIM